MQARSPNFPHVHAPRPWYVQPWPWLLMLGPFLVILAGGYTCWLAYTRPDALVVDDYYLQGKAINQDLRRDRAASALGIEAGLRYDPAAGRLVATLQAFGKPLGGGARVHLVHSTRPEKDIVLTLVPDAGGNLSAALPMLEKARWRVLIEDPQRTWRLAGAWAWPSHDAIVLRADGVGAAAASAAASPASPSPAPVH